MKSATLAQQYRVATQRNESAAAILQAVATAAVEQASAGLQPEFSAVEKVIAAASAEDPGISDVKLATRVAREALDAAQAVADAPPPVLVRPSGDWRNVKEPLAIIWNDGEGDPEAPPYSVAAAGEIAVLAGAGKSGKTMLALRLAVEAAKAERDGLRYGRACGLRVRAGHSVLLSYEMAPKRADQYAENMGAKEKDVLLIPDPAPIYGQSPQTRRWMPSDAWAPTWKAIRNANPVLVIADTGPKAMGGETTDPGAVIGFIQALEREARLGGFAVLVLAHDTKLARDAARRGSELDAGAIAGSGQWHDSPRGVLHLTKTGPGDADRLLECIKASYAPDGWGARLCVEYRGTRYAGLTLVENLTSDALQAARAELRDERAEPSTRQVGNKANRLRKPAGNSTVREDRYPPGTVA